MAGSLRNQRKAKKRRADIRGLRDKLGLKSAILMRHNRGKQPIGQKKKKRKRKRKGRRSRHSGNLTKYMAKTRRRD